MPVSVTVYKVANTEALCSNFLYSTTRRRLESGVQMMSEPFALEALYVLVL
jgi:hypothetical protein